MSSDKDPVDSLLLLAKSAGLWTDTQLEFFFDEPDNITLRKRAVDMIYVEDQDLANEMVSALDDEPMRDVKKSLTQRLQFLSLQSRVSKREIDGLNLSDEPDMPGIFWRNLKKLNSGTMDAPKFRELAPLFAAIEGRRITEVYPILCFGIESCVRNYNTTEEAFGLPTRIFRVCLSSVRLMMNCLTETRDSAVSFTTDAKETPSNVATLMVVKKGEKDQACDFIRDRFAEASASRIYVVDPYFSASELDLVEQLRSQFADSPITVMTSRKCIQELYGSQGLAQVFRSAWKDRCAPVDATSPSISSNSSGVAHARPLARCAVMSRRVSSSSGSGNSLEQLSMV